MSVMMGKGRRRKTDAPVVEDEGRLSLVERQQIKGETQRMIARAMWLTANSLAQATTGTTVDDEYYDAMLTLMMGIHDQKANSDIDCDCVPSLTWCNFRAEIQRLYEVHSGA
jgi:hypothetical protein